MRADLRKAKRRRAVRDRITPAPPVQRRGPGQFEVLCRIDAYADYLALVKAVDAVEAAELACDDHAAYGWEPQGVVEFDDRYYVTLDANGDEIEGTVVGDR